MAEVCGILKIVKWKINKGIFFAGSPVPFVQGDENTAYIKVELESDCNLVGEILECMVLLPAPTSVWIKISALIQEDNTALFLLPESTIWYPGNYQIMLMFTEGSKIKWSASIPGYEVLSNPLAEGPPPVIPPASEQLYLDLIANLNQENSEATQHEIDLPPLNAEATQHEIDLPILNAEATQHETDLTAINLEATQHETDLTQLNSEAVQNISDLNNAIGQVPALIQGITDEGDTQVLRVQTQGNTEVGRVTNEGNTQVGLVQTQGNTEVSNVISEGDTQETRVTNQGNTEVSRVINQGTIEVNGVIAEGNTQNTRIQQKGDDEFQRLNDLIQTSPTGGNAMLLDGRTRTSFEEDIESRAYALDDRLVFAFDPKNRNIENLKHGIYNKNNLTNGDGTIRSEDADSMAGVFKDDRFYCGEGYENLSDRSIIGDDIFYTGITLTLYAVNINFLPGEALWRVDTIDFTNIDTTDMRTFISSDIGNINATELYVNGIIQPGVNIPMNLTGINEIKMKYTFNSETNVIDVKYANPVATPAEFVTVKELFLVKSVEEKPFVKDTAPDGKLIIKEPWTDLTHTIINLDENLDEQQYFIDATGINLHLQNDGITRNNYVSYNLNYEGLLTNGEKTAEIDKVKSGKFIVENNGVYEPLQGAKKRCNEYGQTKNYVILESQSTDIQLVETNKKVYTTSDDGTIRIDRIDNAGVITNISGGAGVENVGGYIRLTVATSPSASTKVKVVIEIVE